MRLDASAVNALNLMPAPQDGTFRETRLTTKAGTRASIFLGYLIDAKHHKEADCSLNGLSNL